MVYALGACEAMKQRFEAVGEGLIFYPTTSLFGYEQISIGRNVFTGTGAYFLGPITIGNDIMFGPKCTW
jgi:acetyltransferase-like isoleucine patch superfamily enzyme